ncbi:MAG TPA: SDR family oxidoreductase [Acidobacteriaceae bacterium]|nr:SDR family oxidoreductase [Acidobacteriaceae bacterium]
MAKVLVTGAAGFIGSSLVRELCKRGHEVRGIDNLITGKVENLSDTLGQIDFREGDVRDEGLIRFLCRNVEVVFHEAALTSVHKSVLDPLTSHRANVDGTFSVLMAARDTGVKRIIYASSSSVYGDSQTLPKHEGMFVGPFSPCAVQKLTGELYMQSFARVYAMETVSLRYFNVYGPGQAADSPYSGVLAKFITSMLSGVAPVIYGDGTQSRDFTYIHNVVQANLLAAWAPAASVSGKVYNIAGGVNYSLLETYYLLAHLIGLHKQPSFAPARNGDVQHSLASIERARQDFGYLPTIGFEDGLSRTIDWYATKLGVPAELTSAFS